MHGAEGSRLPYRYPIEECNVEDLDALKTFRAKRDEWMSWLSGEDQHSIMNQIASMIWNDAVFRIINESRRLGAAALTAHAANSGFLARFMDQCYAATQVLAIRRLVELRA